MTSSARKDKIKMVEPSLFRTIHPNQPDPGFLRRFHQNFISRHPEEGDAIKMCRTRGHTPLLHKHKFRKFSINTLDSHKLHSWWAAGVMQLGISHSHERRKKKHFQVNEQPIKIQKEGLLIWVFLSRLYKWWIFSGITGIFRFF